MIALIIFGVIVAIFLIRVSLLSSKCQDDKGPIVHLDQEAPYKIEPPDHK